MQAIDAAVVAGGDADKIDAALVKLAPTPRWVALVFGRYALVADPVGGGGSALAAYFNETSIAVPDESALWSCLTGSIQKTSPLANVLSTSLPPSR